MTRGGFEDIGRYKRSTRGEWVLLWDTFTTNSLIITDISLENYTGPQNYSLSYESDTERLVTSGVSATLTPDNSVVMLTSRPEKYTMGKKPDGSKGIIINDATKHYKLRFLSDMKEIWSIDSSDPNFHGFFLSEPEIAVSDGGYIYLLFDAESGGECFQIAPDGSAVKTVDLGILASEKNHLSPGADGAIRIWYEKLENGIYSGVIFTIDDATCAIGKKQSVRGTGGKGKLEFAAGYDVYFTYSDGFYGGNDGEDAVRLFDWFDIGVTSGNVVESFILDEKNVYFVYEDEIDGEYKAGYMRYVPFEEYLEYYTEKHGGSAEGLLDRNEITVVASENLRVNNMSGENASEGDIFIQCARKYNRENMQQKINFIRISGDSDTASGNLMRRMLSGDVPDLVLFSNGLESRNFAGKNMFADLYEYIDKDEKYGREAFTDCIFDVYENKDGGLPFLTTDFRFFSMVGTVGNLGDSSGWTLEEFLDMAEELPEDKYLTACFESTKNPSADIFVSLAATSLDRFIDYDNKVCDFDNETFRRLLKLCKDANISTADIFDHRLFSSGDIALLITEDWGVSRSMLSRAVFAGSDTCPIGFPQSGGKSGAAIQPIIQFGIPKNAENRDEAWNFIKYYLDAGADRWKTATDGIGNPAKYIGSFPCVWESVEDMFDAARGLYIYAYFYEYISADTGKRTTWGTWMTGEKREAVINHDTGAVSVREVDYLDPARIEEFGTSYSKMFASNPKYKDFMDSWAVVEFTDKDEEMLRNYFSKPCVAYYDDMKTRSILREEAEAYFSGERSLDDTIRYIQDRVTTRINE